MQISNDLNLTEKELNSWANDTRLTDENYLEKAYFFRERQAGVTDIYNPEETVILTTPIA